MHHVILPLSILVYLLKYELSIKQLLRILGPQENQKLALVADINNYCLMINSESYVLVDSHLTQQRS